MNKIYLYIMVLAVSLVNKTFGQMVNDTPLKELNLPYIQIVAREKILSTNYNFTIDIGNPKQINNGDNRVKDSLGKEIVFSNLTDALNFMDSIGYDFIQSYSLPDKNNTVYYLMKKRESYYQDF